MTPSPSTRCLLPCVGVLAFLLVGMAPASEPFFLPNHDPKPAGQKWLPVENMSDEFDGSALDDTKWQDELESRSGRRRLGGNRHLGTAHDAV